MAKKKALFILDGIFVFHILSYTCKVFFEELEKAKQFRLSFQGAIFFHFLCVEGLEKRA